MQIDQTLSWRNMHPLNLTGFNTKDGESIENNVDYFTYSQELQKGIILDNNLEPDGNNSAMFMVFDVDYHTFKFVNEKRYPPLKI